MKAKLVVRETVLDKEENRITEVTEIREFHFIGEENQDRKIFLKNMGEVFDRLVFMDGAPIFIETEITDGH